MSSTEKGLLSDGCRIASFVVLDLETNDLPYNFSKIAITELCMYGFSTSELETAPIKLEEIDNVTLEFDRPRHLHKLTMLFNPRRLIHPKAEEITGLSNYSLEKESHFDENAAGIITNFLKHMQQPVCLVAHNGVTFDFPIVKQTFKKLNLNLPCETLCIDSLLAFRVLDQQLQLLSSPTDIYDSSVSRTDKDQSVITSNFDNTKETVVEARPTLLDQLDAETKIDWRARNETTPKRPIVTGVKRSHTDNSKSLNSSFKSKRSLFTNIRLDKYPPKDVYKLENMYKRFFKKTPKNVHCAEADVETLMHLMRVYGSSFLTYAENNAVRFEDISLKR
ncbi:DNA polymerase III PolC-type [Bactrocera oleae]|uniref:DNA polymerase III PolC-type n=1 Tax=Bactrocera oleae TaxID=104688 RepID=UPI001748AF70|nr:DNA polymerase III PolC-type [Bactrocera oleae]